MKEFSTEVSNILSYWAKFSYFGGLDFPVHSCPCSPCASPGIHHVSATGSARLQLRKVRRSVRHRSGCTLVQPAGPNHVPTFRHAGVGPSGSVAWADGSRPAGRRGGVRRNHVPASQTCLCCACTETADVRICVLMHLQRKTAEVFRVFVFLLFWH